MFDSIKKNLDCVKERVACICKNMGKEPEEIHILAVTKGRLAGEIQAVYEAGIKLFGENRIQETLQKYRNLKDFKGELHMIGHLQTNKVREAVELFDMIQSVDSLKLLTKIAKEAERQKKSIRLLIQVNVSRDPKKFGIDPEDVFQFFRDANPYLFSKWIKIEGLMTIVEHTEDIEERRLFFKKMKEIFDDLKSLFTEGHIENVEMKYLSMGMSEDFEAAVMQGANLLRLGRAIFEGLSACS